MTTITTWEEMKGAALLFGACIVVLYLVKLVALYFGF